MRSRLVVMEVAHGVRSDSYVDATALKCMKIISRAASIKNVRGRHTRVLALCEISVVRMQNCQKMSRLRCIHSVVNRQCTHGN